MKPGYLTKKVNIHVESGIITKKYILIIINSVVSYMQ